MTGQVDEVGRALLGVEVRNPSTRIESSLTVWIDTGFTGELLEGAELEKRVRVRELAVA